MMFEGKEGAETASEVDCLRCQSLPEGNDFGRIGNEPVFYYS